MATNPESKAALFVLGLAYTKAAMEGRGDGCRRNTSSEQFDLFQQRFDSAERLLEALMIDDRLYGLAARAAIVHGYFRAGDASDQLSNWVTDKICNKV